MNAVPLAAAGNGERRALRFLADLSQSLALSLDLRETFPLAVSRIVDFMQAEAASLFLLDPARGVLECRLCQGPVDITGLTVAVGQGVVGRCVAENATQLVRDASADARVNARVDAETGFLTRSIVCAPLATAQGPIGALEIINRRDGSLFDADDAEVLRLIAAPAALAIGNAQLAQGLVEQQRIQRELELARRMQKSMLPKRRRGDFPIRGVNLPAHEISGDFFDFFDLPDGRLAFVIGDVSGKGLDAAFLMVRVESLLRWVGTRAPAPGAWLGEVNAQMCRFVRDGRFVCAAVGQYDRGSGTVRLASAGFPPALLHDGVHFEELAADGPPLGILAEADYGEREFTLGKQALYLFSDGATDVRTGATDRLGENGLRGLIARHAGLAPEPRLRALLGDLKRLKLVDDTTLLLLQEPRGAQAHGLLELEFPAQAAQMRGVRAALRHALDAQGIAPELRDQLVLAVDEACTNIIRHAYGGECTRKIALRLGREHERLVFELRDQAPAVDPACLKLRDLSECKPGGLGLPFIDALMDDWKILPAPDGHGNILRMRKRIPMGEHE
ncbi:MAG: SpoIIE family protein phosphatase [Proteobacteria bacterium]|nr:SpoIIE family protein phosphatase [Pseudomonadota bacterium]